MLYTVQLLLQDKLPKCRVVSCENGKDGTSATLHRQLSAAELVTQLTGLTLGLHHALHLCWCMLMPNFPAWSNLGKSMTSCIGPQLF